MSHMLYPPISHTGHRIKNRNCRLVKELKHIHSVSRLLLTGTPIQVTRLYTV